MIQIKEDHGHYLEIYCTEFKILEKQNEQLWNAYDEDHCIAVDKKRYEKGDYVESDVLLDIEGEENE